MVVYGELYKEQGALIVNASAVYRLDLHPDYPAVFDSYLHGVVKIVSVINAPTFSEFPGMTSEQGLRLESGSLKYSWEQITLLQCICSRSVCP